MRASTYSFFILLALLENLGAEYEYKQDLTRVADNIARSMNHEPNLCVSTKYLVIRDLEKAGLIVLGKIGGSEGVALGDNVEKFIVKAFEAIEVECE